MTFIGRLLERGITIISKRPPIPETPSKLIMSKEEWAQLVPNFYDKEVARDKRREEIEKAKAATQVPTQQTMQSVFREESKRSHNRKENLVEETTKEKDYHLLNNIKLSDRIHAALVHLLASGKLQEPLLLSSDIHICNVNMTHSRMKVIVQWSLLARKDEARLAAIDDAFDRHKKSVAHAIGKQVQTKFIPSYLFEYKEDPFE
jgi:ribosome-binding factor A